MIINVKLHPNSKKGPLVLAGGDSELVVYLREKPKDGAANLALIKILAKHFSVSKSRVNIISGHKSRNKQVEVK